MRSKLSLLLLILFLLIPGAQAQDDWSIFLFDGIERSLLRISGLDGSQESYSLGLSETQFLSGFDLAINADGSRVAFCANGPSESNLIVRDLATATNVITIPLGQTIGCRVTSESLSPDGDIVLVSTVYSYPGDPNANPASLIRSLMGLDAASGSMMFELNDESPLAAQAGLLTDTAIMPEVRYFDGNKIIFAEVPYGVGGAPDYRAFAWQPAAGILELDESGRWGKSGLSVLDTVGEMVYLDHDSTRPALDPNSPLPALNVVKYVDANGSETLLHHTADWILADTAFINDGEEVALLYVAAFDMDSPVTQETRWMALDRSGGLRQLASDAAFSQIDNAPGGYVLFEMFLDDGAQDFEFRLSYNDSLIWEAIGMGWELVGVSAAPAATNLLPFQPLN